MVEETVLVPTGVEDATVRVVVATVEVVDDGIGGVDAGVRGVIVAEILS